MLREAGTPLPPIPPHFYPKFAQVIYFRSGVGTEELNWTNGRILQNFTSQANCNQVDRSQPFFSTFLFNFFRGAFRM